MIKKFGSFAGASALAFGLGLAMMPGSAQAGFLDQLFGGAPTAPQAAPAPSYQYDEPSFMHEAPARPHLKRKVVDAKPKLQKPTDLMHDATLQNGDAVMMKGGIEIYMGDDATGHHAKSDFEPIGDVDGVSKQERKALVAMDTTRNDPLRGSLNPDTIASGRSAAVSSPIVAGHEIVDASGKTVRYVGP